MPGRYASGPRGDARARRLRSRSTSQEDFEIDLTRRPLFFVDVHLHTGEVLQVRSIPEGSGWGLVLTPTF